MTNQLTACPPSDAVGLERMRYFSRQLIGPADLTQDQLYFREKLRRHNRLLHGWGVVCGARVRREDDCTVVVEPGYILGPYGDEIMIDREVTVDLCHETLDGNAVSPCSDLLDPWCSSVRVDRQAGQRLYLAVRYAECQARPVRVQANGCGCDETECEYSRIRDSYAIKVLTQLPGPYEDPMPQPDSESIVSCVDARNEAATGRLCPPCPPEPWVILADVVLDGAGNVDSVDCFAHRRYVASFADFYFLCQQSPGRGLRETDVVTDLTAEASGRPARASALVALARPDRSVVYLPANFTVEAGETFETFLGRESERAFYDPATETHFTLGDLYAIANVDPLETVGSVTEALAPLEGVSLRVNELRSSRTELAEHLDSEGVNRLESAHAGAPAAATELPARMIRGLGAQSTLGQKLADRTVSDIASMSRDGFIEFALEGVSAGAQSRVERQANEVWERAATISRLGATWRSR